MMTNKNTGNFKLRNILGALFIVCSILLLGTCDNGFVEAIEKDIAASFPKLGILVDGSELTGNTYDFQEQVLDSAKTVDLVLKNMGEAPLVFQDPQYVLVPNSGDEGIFEIRNFNASAVQAGDSFTCSLDFTPSDERGYSASITIYSNDPDTPEYTFAVTGTGYVPADGLFYVNNNDSYSNSTTVNLNMNFTTNPESMRFSNTSAGLSSASWEPYSETRSGWVLESGADESRTVYAQFRDSLGFYTDKQDSIYLDTTSPTGSITSINGSDEYTTSRIVTLNVSAGDTASGVVSMRFVSSNTLSSPTFPGDDTGWSSYSTSSAYEIPAASASGDGTKYIYAQFRDAAENISTTLIWNSITLDTAGPTGSILIDGGDAYATSRSVTLTLSASDATSGVKNMRFADSSSSTQPNMSSIPWKSYSTSSAYNITSDNEGTKYVFAQYQDNAGKISTATISDNITLDTTDPSGYISVSYGDSFTNTTKVRIDLSHVSGATQMSFSGNISPVSLRSYSSYIDVTLTTGEGNKTINGYFRDAAGNDVTLSDSIYLNAFTISHTESTGTGMGGTSVDISADGEVVAIGIPYRSWMKPIGGMTYLTLTQVGAFSVLRKSGSTWSGDGGLQHDGLNYSNFGLSVSVSPSGNYISIGAPNDGADTNSTYGKIYRYYYSGGSWTLNSTISGSSSRNDTGLTVLDTDTYRYYKDRNTSGYTYIYRYGGTSKQSYSHTYALRDLDGSGSGSSDRIIWGSPLINTSKGLVYIYDRLLNYVYHIGPSDASDNQRFGYSVAISADAQTIVASTGNDEAYIFQYSSGWVQRQKISKPADAGIAFANSVAVSGDGTTVVIGCPSYNSWKGAVYIYVKRSQDNTWELVNRYSLGGTISAEFGESVAISDDGSTVVVGAPTSDSGSADSKVYILE